MNKALSSSWQVRKLAVKSEHGIVASQNRIASEVGADVLSKGGNAIDAAIATSFALGVVEPWMSGIGGGGYMVIRLAGEPTAKVVEFGMRSPENLDVRDYPITGGKASDLFPWPAVKDDRNVFGALAVAIPGQVAGMALALQSFGTKPWQDLIAPSVVLAKQGLTVDWYAQLILASAASDLAKYPASKATFLDKNGFPKSSAWTALGSTTCNLSNLARSLETIGDEGASAFYEGSLAQSIIKDLNSAGGRHTLEDLKKYEAKIVDAAEYKYRDHRVFGTPNLTAGPTLQRTFELLESWNPSGADPDASSYVAYDSAIRQANAERFDSMGDIEHEPAPSCTTNFSVVDCAGNMVVVTQTLLSIFGSRMMLPESGILMNNGIMWFDPEPGKPNSLAPSKQCLANMCPTLLERADGTQFALGAAGGRKIMPAVAQLASFLLDYGMDLQAAFQTPRIDVSLADITIADDTFTTAILEEMRTTVSNVQAAPRTIYPFNFACPSAVSRKGAQNTGATEIMSPWADAVASD